MIVATFHRAIASAVVSTIITMFRWSIRAMLRSPVVPRRHHVVVEVARPPAGRHCRPAVVHQGPLRTIGPRGMFVLDLLSPGFKMMLVLRDPFAFAGSRLNSVRPAVVADVIDRGVVHDHGPVVGVVDDSGVDVGHRAVVHKFSTPPFAAPETHARVAVPVINAAVEAYVWSPIAPMPYVKAIGKSPIAWRPDVARAGANRLGVHRQDWRPYADRNANRNLCV